jgi:hypothetical protein
MTYVITAIALWPSLVDWKTIVGIIGAIACVILGHLLTRWRDRVGKRRELDSRMSNVEHGIENLKTSLNAKIDTMGASLGGELKAMNSTIATMPIALGSLRQVVEAHQETANRRHELVVRNGETQSVAIQHLHDDLRTQHASLISRLDNLSSIPDQIRRDLTDHVRECGLTVIAPVVKRVEVLEGVS